MSNDLINSVSKNLLRKKNVVAVATGHKWSDGRDTGSDALLVFVSQKESEHKLSDTDKIPKNIDGIQTDVVGKSGLFEKQSFTARQRPYQGGISCGHLFVTAGTIGGFFIDGEGDVVGLSNNHVIAAENAGRRGHLTIQPGLADNGAWLDNRVGTLKYFRDLIRSGQQSFNAADWSPIVGHNLEDAGIFKVDDPALVDPNIKGIGLLNEFRDTIDVNEDVKKSGRTTQVTTGKVIGLNATVMVNYGRYTLEFRDQIITTGMSQPGDSGSLLLDSNNNVVGLLFAGSNSMTIHNRIRYPRSSWGLSIYRAKQITESIGYTLKIDGATQSNSYSSATDLIAATELAKRLARQEDKDVEISVNYRARPVS